MTPIATSPKASDGPEQPAHEQEDATALSQLIHVSTIILQQAIDLIDGTLSDDAQLSFSSNLMPGSTIGKHLRHARDHFTLLLDAVSGPPPIIFSYDVRSRNTPMETSLTAAREALKQTIERLQGLEIDMEEEVTLNAVTPYMQVLKSSFGRELWFAALHAVHHWSMVRVVAGELDLKVEDTFGVAPSTLIYRGNEGPLGKAKI